MDEQLALRLVLALAIGLVVGLERGWRERDMQPGSRTAGIRTYGLAGLFGGVSAAVAAALATPLLLGLFFLGFAGVFAWFKRAEAEVDGDFSVTGTVAGMLVFGLGALAVAGDSRLAGAGGVAVAAVLASRDYLHALMRRLTWVELRSFLLLLGMTALVLPVLPDQAYGPYGGVNPRQVWALTIMVATLSYVGYVAIRMLGAAKGSLVTGLAGGLVSSTAITVAFARRSADGEPPRLLAAGAAVAGAVSLARVLVILMAVQPALVRAVMPAAGAAILAFLLPAGLIAWRASVAAPAETRLGNPFDLGPVFGFALLLAGIGLVAGFVTSQFGDAALYGLALVSGLVDVDAVSLSSARLAGVRVPMETAATAVLLALFSNAAARAAYGFALGHRAFALPLAAMTCGAMLAGGLAFLI